jgi:dCMP deaminase
MTDDSALILLARSAAPMARCQSRQLGCVLQCGKDLVFGWNGPPKEIEACDPCPRPNSSGRFLHLCRAVHAERRTLLKAAKMGISTHGSTLYCDFGPPCKDCLIELIEAGVEEIVCIHEKYYDDLSEILMEEWISKGGKFRIAKNV